MWILLALITALFTSFQDVCGRKALERTNFYIVAWAWAACSVPFLFVAALQEGFSSVQPQFWPALMFSGIFLSISFIWYFQAIHITDLSLAVPMLAFTPVYLIITSPLILGEFCEPLGIIGIFLIVIGSYVLNFKHGAQGFFEPFRCLVRNRGTRLMLYVSLIFSITGNIDKIGVLNSGPAVWMFSLNMVISAILGIVVFFRVPNPVVSFIKSWRILILMGLFTGIALIVQMHAIRMTIVPYIIAIKRMSIVVTTLFGLLWFKEKGLRQRLLGVLLMLAGVFVISFFAS